MPRGRKTEIIYPLRDCRYCGKYPCFRGQGENGHTLNFASYGCVSYMMDLSGNKKVKTT